MADQENQDVTFYRFDKPALKSGSYTVNMTLDLELSKTVEILPDSFSPELSKTVEIPPDSFSLEYQFQVYGERFALKPGDIHSVYPPSNSIGDFSNVIPQIVLNRSTMPWEREPVNITSNSDEDDCPEQIPWLAVLLFNESDQPESKIIKLLTVLQNPQDYVNESESNETVKWHQLDDAELQYEDAEISVIDVKWQYLKYLIPDYEDLGYLAHVRQRQEGNKRAVVIGNRIPDSSSRWTAYLVSLEHLYTDGNQFEFCNSGDNDYVRLISLFSWSFSCKVSENNTAHFVELASKIHPYPLQNVIPIQLNGTPKIVDNLQKGYVPLPHRFRTGQQTISWYHGPLLPGDNDAAFDNSISNADELVRYNESTGMFDISYAAAWELGRLLILQNRQAALELHNWKRAYTRVTNRSLAQQMPIPLAEQSIEMLEEIPEILQDWFSRLSNLELLPFIYLVPDERMLPEESMRLFSVDNMWIDCLLDGAFSVGRMTKADLDRDKVMKQNFSLNQYNDTKLTGILLRSEIVSAWPDLIVQALDINEVALNQLIFRRLSPSILLCIFEQDINCIKLRLKPETLHFEVTSDSDPESNMTIIKPSIDYANNWSDFVENSMTTGPVVEFER